MSKFATMLILFYSLSANLSGDEVTLTGGFYPYETYYIGSIDLETGSTEVPIFTKKLLIVFEISRLSLMTLFLKSFVILVEFFLFTLIKSHIPSHVFSHLSYFPQRNLQSNSFCMSLLRI